MKVDLHNMLIEKAKQKKDGVYSYRGYLYAVKNKTFIGYSDCYGYAFSVNGSFHVGIGKLVPYDRKKSMLNIFIKNE